MTEAGGLVGNFTGESDFLEQKECLAGAPRIYGQLVTILGKFSKFASAGDKAAVRDAVDKLQGDGADSEAQAAAEGQDADSAEPKDAPF